MHIKEAFIEFIHLERTTGKAIADGLLGLPSKHGLDVKYIRGQAYDGASAMPGESMGSPGTYQGQKTRLHSTVTAIRTN